MENELELKRLEHLSDDELLETYLGYRAFYEMSYLFGHGHAKAGTPEEASLNKSYSMLWKKLSFGLGSKISWYPDANIKSMLDKIRKIYEDRGEEIPISQRTEVGQVLDIWTCKLGDMGLRFGWDFDIPGPPPTEQEADNLVEIGRLLHIDDAVREFYTNN